MGAQKATSSSSLFPQHTVHWSVVPWSPTIHNGIIHMQVKQVEHNSTQASSSPCHNIGLPTFDRPEYHPTSLVRSDLVPLPQMGHTSTIPHCPHVHLFALATPAVCRPIYTHRQVSALQQQHPTYKHTQPPGWKKYQMNQAPHAALPQLYSITAAVLQCMS
jgi:hypothetical protein